MCVEILIVVLFLTNEATYGSGVTSVFTAGTSPLDARVTLVLPHRLKTRFFG